ncbi:MAG: hypothetical protein Q9166_001237 [cf. Caloplaca sp. 2 TL-2023]
MKIAALQFSPKLGLVDQNIAHADFLLSSSTTPLDNLDLLVLPELAFTGYNHPSLPSITPYLEPTAAGTSTKWAIFTARRLRCLVSIGYPELYSPTPPPKETLKSTMLDLGPNKVTYYTLTAYNSTVTVNPAGEVVAHYRKTHLYYTDEVWAQESPEGFTTTNLHFPVRPPPVSPDAAALSPTSQLRTTHTTTFAICMDLNNRHFIPSLSPSHPSELCKHILSTPTTLLILSTAWLTHLPSSSLSSQSKEPDLNTLAYWFDALAPVINNEREVICVFANRCGEEAGRVVPDVKGDLGGEGGKEGKEDVEAEGVRYAGSSWIGKVGKGEVVIGRVMGRAEERVCVVETEGLGVGGRGWRVVFGERGDGEK